MARGGRRVGTPGTAYPNRTDLHQPVKAAPGGEYGSVTQLRNAQKVIPLPDANPPMPPPAAAGTPAPPGGGGGVAPGDINFTAPTNRPNEPVTAGLPIGPGPGPEALGMGPAATDPSIVLRAMYRNVPEARNNDVLRLIEALDKQVQ